MLMWDSAPHSFSTARNLDTVYGLYGRGLDRLYGDFRTDTGRKGVMLRLARAPLDVFVAWLTTVTGHEFGHCQHAWLAGSTDCHWVSAPGPYALGHIITVNDAGSLTSAGRQSITTGGTESSIAGADAMKREIFGRGRLDWSSSALLVVRQLDISLYGMTAPSPANAQPDDYANDMTNYAIRYGARSGRGGEAVHRSIVRAAWWEFVDPMSWHAAYSYITSYGIRGERSAPAPGFTLLDRWWMATTNAWLSEVGVRYSLGVFTRGLDSADVLEVTPSWGEGQLALDIRYSLNLKTGWRAGLTTDFWRQRASAAPGPLKTGGAVAIRSSREVGRVTFLGELGHKTSGVMLGQSSAAGWYFTVGAAITTR